MALGRGNSFQLNQSNQRIENNKQLLFCFLLHSACHMMSNWTAFSLTSVPFWGLIVIPEVHSWLRWGVPSRRLPPEDLPIKKKNPGRSTVTWLVSLAVCSRWWDCQDKSGELLPSKARGGSHFLLLHSNHKRIPRDPYVEQKNTT